jgi:hypothetical protein
MRLLILVYACNKLKWRRLQVRLLHGCDIPLSSYYRADLWSYIERMDIIRAIGGGSAVGELSEG